jgi:Ca2+-binding EF-hand superfamily protein
MTPLPRRAALALGAAFLCLSALDSAHGQDRRERDRRSADEKLTPDQFEEKVVKGLAERIARASDREVNRWHKELARVYPGEVGEGVTRDDVKKWFDVLAGGGAEWKRSTTDAKLGALFDRVAARLDLGPVRSIRRDEFERFARRNLRASRGPDQDDFAEDAARAFRVLDRDGDGELAYAECPAALRIAFRGDPDFNGRITPEEFRDYFNTRVAEAAKEAAKARAAQGAKDEDDGDGLPPWFAEFDLNGDGQVSLYEWRMSDQPADEFAEMDLDGDGLLTPREYEQYAREAELKQDDEPRR